MSRKIRMGSAVLLAALVIMLVPMLTNTAHASAPTPPFTQCPAIGADSSCALLIVINPTGSANVYQDGSQGPFDRVEDTLVGIQNNSPIPLTSIPLTSSASPPIFAFETDGLCSGAYGSGSGSYIPPTGCPFGATGYEGPNTSFTITDPNSGFVNFPTPLLPGHSTYFSLEGAVNASGIVIPTTTTTYNGATSGDFNDPATVSASLTDHTGAPLSGKTITFTLNGAETCTGTTGSTGTASCSVTPAEAAGAYIVTASFAGDSTHIGSTTSSPFIVTLEESALTSTTSLQVIATGGPTTLSATLTDPVGGAGIPNKPVTITLGSQSCTGTTVASGVASCTINPVTGTLGPTAVTDTFAGDAFYVPATHAQNALLFAFLAQGAFAIGDETAAAATSSTVVTWWGAQWRSLNSLSGGAAPAAFKGFAKNMTPTLPSCGGTWTTSPGNSPPPPGSVPSYMGVIVTSKVTQSGSTISGNITHIVVVQTNPGYDPNAGHAGTGTIVAQYC